MVIGIIGLGLIGGSLAKAFSTRVPKPRIIVYDRNRPEEDEFNYEYADNLEDLSDCDFIFICSPVNTIAGYAKDLNGYIKKGAVITDVGSTKNNIFAELKGLSVPYIGGHPMTGSELSGYSAAKAHLFENAYYILSPSENVSNEQVSSLKALIEMTGAITIIIPADAHDKAVAAISHAPHIIAAAMVNAVKCRDDENRSMFTLAAGGFRDITRIASSSPDMWSVVSLENSACILSFLEAFEDIISGFKDALRLGQEEKLYEFFEEAKAYRDSMEVRLSGGYFSIYQIFVDIMDVPGMIATVAALLSANKINIKNIGIVNNREFEKGALQILFDNEEDMNKGIKLLKEMNFAVSFHGNLRLT